MILGRDLHRDLRRLVGLIEGAAGDETARQGGMRAPEGWVRLEGGPSLPLGVRNSVEHKQLVDGCDDAGGPGTGYGRLGPRRLGIGAPWRDSTHRLFRYGRTGS